MSRRIWIILAALLLCNAIGLAVLMADSEANAAELSSKAKANSAFNTKAAAAPMAAAAAFATITVTTRIDEGQPKGSGGTYTSTSRCSLREAITAAQSNVATGGCAAGSSSGTDIININLVPLSSEPDAVFEEIDVERVLPDITTNLNIVGVNPNISIIQRSHAAGVPEFRLFNISSIATVTISGVTICNGLGNMNGVALQNGGNLTLDGVLVTANNIEQDIATPTGNGTVNNFGTMTITNSDITNNRAGVGAGIYNTNSLTISKTSISGNIAVEGAGGGFYNVGTAAITTLDRSVIKANIANDGGGIYNATGGTITLTNSSIGLNEGLVSGSAIYNEGNASPKSTINLRSVTISKHASTTGDTTHDAAIYVDADSVITYRNSIFSDGLSDSSGTFTNFLNQGGTLTSEGHNISNDSSAVLGATGDKPAGTDPLLDPAGIATFGNTTENPDRIESFRLRCGSPAIDAASNSGGTAAPANDARNVARIGLPDIGSYEFNYQITTASPLPNFTQGVAYSVTFAAQGGETPYVWTKTAGTLPLGLSLDLITGTLSGTPTVSGTFNFTVEVGPDQAANYCPITKVFTLQSTVSCSAITVNPTSLTAATCDSPYSQAITSTGGTGSVTYSLQAGSSLPAGLTLTGGGSLSGTPTVPGTYNFTIVATDANLCTGTRAYTLVVGCPVITVGVPAGTTATTGTLFSGTFTSSKAGATFSLNSGTLPTGLSLSGAGVLNGTPTQSGSFPITVKATVGGICTGTSATYTLVVSVGCSTITLSNTTLPAATCDSVYSPQTVTASGGTSPYTFTLNSGSSLPTGMTLSTGGAIGGTPTVVGTFSFTIKATDNNGCTGTRLYSLTVNCPTITVGVPAGTTATTGTLFSGTFTSSKAGSTFSLNSGSLPTGVTLSSAGVLSGTPTQAGSFPITVKATVGTTCMGTSATYTLVVSCPTITLSATTLPAATCDSVYGNQTITASGGSGAYSFTLNAGSSLPTGMTLSTAGVIGGTPTVVGSFNFTIRATDANGCSNTRAYSLTVNCPTITVGLPATNTASTSNLFSGNFTSNKAGATFTLNSGTLPTGISLSTAGVLNGTPTQTGSFPITVKATVGTCMGTSATYTLTVSATCGTITLSATTLPAATCDSAYTAQTVTAGGGTGPYTYTLQVGSSLPTGMSLSTGGAISGTPTVVGAFNFTVCATDANGCKGTRAYSLTVNCPTITVGVPAVTTATTGTSFSRNFTSSKAGATFTLNSGTLPTGVTLSSAGVLSGTPTQAGSFPITVKATVGTCMGTSATYTLVVGCPTITLSATTLPAATCDSVYGNQTLTASGGSGAYSFTVNAGSSLPTGMTLSTTGIIGGTPTVVGSFNFTICATDANGCKGTRAYSLTINCPTITVSPSGATLTAATAGTAYSQAFTSSKSGSTFSTTSTLPTGLTLSNTTGVLSGTPTQTGTFSIVVTATAGTCTGSRTYSLTVNCPTITLTPTTLPGSNANTAYPNQQFSASGGGSSYTYKVLSGALPTGLMLSGAGLLSGTPTANGTFNFTICATGVAGCTGQTAYTVIIGGGNTAPTITAGATLSRQQGNASGAAVTIATVSDAQTAAGSLTVTQIAGGTATGITLSNITNTNGTITAQVAANCTAVGGTICLQVSDGSLTAKANLTVNVTANVAPTLTYNTPDPVMTGVTSTVNPATGPSDNGSISSIVLQSVTPSVTAGVITVNNTSGVITINSTIPVGTYTVAVRATDNCGTTTNASFTLNVIGSLLITEARFSGPSGVNDWYVELYNNTASTVNTTGLKLGLLNANGTQLVSYDLPSNRTIAPRGYFLVAGSAFSLASVAAPDLSAAALAGGFNAAGAGLFRGATTDPTKRLDSLCLNSITGASTYGFYIETTAVGNVGSTTAEHAWVRKSATSGGLPVDTNVNQSDFALISTSTTAINGLTPTLGASSPQSNTTPPIAATTLPASTFSSATGASSAPNLQRDLTPITGPQGNYPLGSLYWRRTYTNNTGAPITKLRFRIIAISDGTLSTQANLRAIDSADITINGVPVKGLTLETPPAQPNGGGLNSTLRVASVTLASPIASGAPISVQYRLGVIRTGSYLFSINLEATN